MPIKIRVAGRPRRWRSTAGQISDIGKGFRSTENPSPSTARDFSSTARGSMSTVRGLRSTARDRPSTGQKLPSTGSEAPSTWPGLASTAARAPSTREANRSRWAKETICDFALRRHDILRPFAVDIPAPPPSLAGIVDFTTSQLPHSPSRGPRAQASKPRPLRRSAFSSHRRAPPTPATPCPGEPWVGILNNTPGVLFSAAGQVNRSYATRSGYQSGHRARRRRDEDQGRTPPGDDRLVGVSSRASGRSDLSLL